MRVPATMRLNFHSYPQSAAGISFLFLASASKLNSIRASA
jgi:hypothetical protein